ncbi:oligoendopeptidase F [Geosporobacter ferrireducens]|nr:oligoendopeptidase F [Geosporobacter ferrireducens]
MLFLRKSVSSMKGLVWTLLFVMLFSSFTVFASQGEISSRDQIASQYKWKLEHIYPTDGDWEKDYKKLEEMIPKMDTYKGKLAQTDQLIAAFKLREDMLRISDKLTVYAGMKSDEDNANDTYGAMVDRADGITAKLKAAAAFIEPEILKFPEDTLKDYMQKAELKDYSLYFDNLLRTKAHRLSETEEALLALAGEMAAAPENVYTSFRYVDRRIGEIEDEEGKKVKVSPATYSGMLEHPNRDMRKKAFEAEFTSFKESINVLAAALSGEVKSNVFFAKARKYDSALEAALAPDNIQPEVYNSLIEAVNNNLEPLHRYVSLRKKLLGIGDKVHFYDMYVSMVPSVASDIKYEDGQQMMLEALSALGEEYISDLKKGLSSGWIDVYETQNKYSGAYSWGAYDTHPYVLLNYNGTLDAVSTLAHEMGHALNTYYSNQHQPYAKAEYPIFTAEVASTTNEALMLDYLIKNAETKQEKMYLINSYLEQIRGSIYTQIMYAEFEKEIHDAVESGEALNATFLNETWGSLMKKYYGEDFEVDELAKVWWSRIPHFYWNFYVYKYATGLSAGIILSDKIATEGKPARDAYLNFLKAGGSDYPVEMLKAVGVDLSNPEPVEKALVKFNDLLDEFESLMQE